MKVPFLVTCHIFSLQLHHEPGFGNDGYTILYNSNGKTKTDASASLLPRLTSPSGYGAIDGSTVLTSSLRTNGLPIRKLEKALDDDVSIQVSLVCSFCL